MSNIESEFSPRYTRSENGGSLYTLNSEGDGYVAFTKFGEFGCQLTEQGGLIAEFPEHGFTFYYDDEGKIELAVLDVSMYLASMDSETLLSMPNGGINIYGMVEYLTKNNLSICAYMDIKNSSMEMDLIDENGKSKMFGEYDNANYIKGLRGDIEIGGNKVTFEFADYDGDLMMSLGEANDKRGKLVGVMFSSFVDFEMAFFGDDPKRFQYLASNIVLQ